MNEEHQTRITKVTIDGFGPLHHFSQEIGNLTIVFGRNETGKSSIVDAVYAWFRRDAKFRGKPLDVRSGEGFDGEVDLEDHAIFADCLAGPDAPVAPTQQGVTAEICLRAFDSDADTDVDLHDFRSVQEVFAGE